MKKTFLLCSLLGLSFFLFSQSSNTYINNYVQPAPNVAALGKYADYPVSYYTGVPEIGVPIYQLRDGAVNFPISLSYHNSGIRVAEVASWVGLGWALNAGGMIARAVRGAPDEGTLKGIGYAIGPRGYYIDNGLSKLPLLPYPTNGVIDGTTANYQMQQFTAPYVDAGTLDCEPDLFTFNFNGYTGKFVFDENQTPRLLNDADVRIAINYSSNQFLSWIITTPDGTKYYFGENGMHETTLPHSTISPDDLDAQKPSSWFLTRIVYPNTKDTVYFDYGTENYSYKDLPAETKMLGAGQNELYQACNYFPQQGIVTTTIQGLQLLAVRTKNFTISFRAKTSRQDVIVNSNCNMLDTIKVASSQGTILSQFIFKHTYFTSTTATQVIAGWISDNTDIKRLKLLSVQEYSGDLSTSKPAHVFTYNETLQLPRRMSYDQDHWGFSNNSAGNSNAHLTPLVNSPLCSSSLITNSRDSRYPDMAAFSLTSIRDPLGALTTFVTEGHNGGTIGGLRIKQIVVTDSVTGKLLTRSFTYSDGIVYKQPKYMYILNNEFYLSNGTFTSTSYRGYTTSSFPIYNILRTSSSAVPLQDFNGNHIGYTVVKETLGPNGEGGSKEYHFLNTVSPLDNSRLNMSNYTATSTINVPLNGSVTGLFGSGHFNDLSANTLQYCNRYDIDNYYPTCPQQVDIRRGKLLYEFDYDSSGTMIRQIQNTYKDFYHEWMPIRGFKASITSSFVFGAANNQVAMTALAYYKLHTGISKLVSTTTIDYKDAKQFIVNHTYGYEDTLHTLRTSDTTVNSAGDSLIQKTYYSYDYANSATADNVFGKMKARNMLIPIATRNWKNNQLIGGTISVYKDFASAAPDTFINPAKIYSLETSSPLTIVQAGESVSFTTPFTSIIPNSSFIEKADFNYSGTTGKITEQKLVFDKNQSLIWDNYTFLPLAQVENAYFNDVAFTSFETAESGNWIYGSSSVVSDVTAPTGVKAYTLGTTAISKTGLTAATKYVVSWWQKTGASVTVTGGTQSNSLTGNVLNGYTYKEVQTTGTTSISISGSGSVDEVRLYPATAQMTSYTYDPMLRLIAQSSPNGVVSYYEYDLLHRLVDVKDQFGNIRKAFEYNYGRNNRVSQ